MFRKYNFNLDYFREIDNKEKAYWLGFIYAEGNVYKNTLSIKLADIDGYVLEQFRDVISSNYPVKKVKNKNAKVIKVNSKILIQQLNDLGVCPNKSAKITWPLIKAELIPAFILGYYDGDGWITAKNCSNDCTKEWLGWAIGFGSASKRFIASLRMILKGYGFGNGYHVVRKKDGNRKTHYQLCYYGECAKLILDKMYCTNFCIKRKAELYEKFKKYLDLKNYDKISKYKGVCFDKNYKKWHSRIQINCKRFIIGFYDSELDAVTAYNNFIDLHPEIPNYKKNVLREVI